MGAPGFPQGGALAFDLVPDFDDLGQETPQFDGVVEFGLALKGPPSDSDSKKQPPPSGACS